MCSDQSHLAWRYMVSSTLLILRERLFSPLRGYLAKMANRLTGLMLTQRFRSIRLTEVPNVRFLIMIRALGCGIFSKVPSRRSGIGSAPPFAPRKLSTKRALDILLRATSIQTARKV